MTGPVQGTDDGTTGYGVEGISASATGVLGSSQSSIGVYGQVGTSRKRRRGTPGAATPQAGVAGYGYGIGRAGPTPATYGVYGASSSGGDGVHGDSEGGNGVSGTGAQNGVYGISTTTEGDLAIAGVNGVSNGDGAGVLGQSYGNGPGVLAIARGQAIDVLGLTNTPGLGAFVAGDMLVTGNVTTFGDVILANSDCAEDFDVADSDMEPGTVVTLDETGRVEGCRHEYDKRVVGVISGAGSFRPGIILGKQQSEHLRMPVALFGKVYCKVDARRSPITVGDVLTTSTTPGHAMKATDRAEAFGAIIGKALGQLEAGLGLIPILVVLQ